MTVPDGCFAHVAAETGPQLLRVRVAEQEARAAVGSGDAFLAGYVAARYDGGTPEECLRFGVACGAESTQHFGAGVIDPQAVERLLPSRRGGAAGAAGRGLLSLAAARRRARRRPIRRVAALVSNAVGGRRPRRSSIPPAPLRGVVPSASTHTVPQWRSRSAAVRRPVAPTASTTSRSCPRGARATRKTSTSPGRSAPTASSCRCSASALDGVVSPETAGIIGRLGGLAVLNLEGIFCRYEDVDAQLERIASLTARRRRARCRRSTASRSSRS